MGRIKELAPGVVMGMNSGVVIETSQRKVEPDAVGKISTSTNPYAIWGTDNKYPLHVFDKVKKDPVSEGALGFKMESHYGLGPQLCKVEYVKQGNKTVEILQPVALHEYPEIDDFFFENDIENFLQGIVQDYEWFNRYYVQYIPNKSKNKILKVNSGLEEIGSPNFLRTKDVRKKKRNKETGRIDGFFISHDWTESQPKYVEIPAFDKRNPFKHSNAIYEHKLVSNHNDYYLTPRWFSSLQWLEVAARIPRWIISNIDNSLNIKYHIQYPEKYFEDLHPEDKYETTQARETAIENAKEKLFKAMDDMLAGEKNAGKSLQTAFVIDQDGKQLPGWTINPVPNELKDEAWLKADQSAAIRIMTAHGVNAGLAGVILSNTSAGSASDVREQLNAHNQLKTIIPRQTTTEWFEVVKRVNGWDRDLKLTYRNIILQSFNENKSGFAQQNEATPTTPEK